MENRQKKYINFMEKVVEELVYKVVEDMDICKCEVCVRDIAARSLNQIIPKYVVSQKGYNYTKLKQMDPQFEVDVMAIIAQAAKIVNGNKRHE